MEVSVAPAPGPDGDILVVTNSSRGAGGSGGADDEMSDMMNDAVMLEFEAAEQLVELQRQLEQQLTLGEGGSKEGEEVASAAEPAENGGCAGEAEPSGAVGEPQQAVANGSAVAAAADAPEGQQPGAAAAAEKQPAAAVAAAEEEDDPQFNAYQYWKASFEVPIDDELEQQS